MEDVMNSNPIAQKNNLTPEQDRAIRKRFTQVIVQTLLMGAILFISAGTLDWAMAWLMMGFYVVMLAVNAILMMRRNPEMVAERAEVKEGTKSWDLVLTSLGALLWLLILLVTGLDKRFGWSPEFSIYIQLLAFIFAVLGYAFASWAMLSNPFFSGTVRIQEERGHTVTSTGPYSYVRHPGYSGWSLANLATPVALGSLVGLVPAVLFLLNLIIRTAMEDQTLQDELDGYKAYTQQVRYRLIPWVW
jgi:protein-S-isoprenylcysteine O-methyltransferase Ste14